MAKSPKPSPRKTRPVHKPAMISLRLTDQQKAWLEQQEAETGNDASSTIRLLIHRAMTGGQPTVLGTATMTPSEAARLANLKLVEEQARKERERQAKIAAKRAELEALERGEELIEPSPLYDDADPEPEGEFDETELIGETAAPAAVPRGPAFSVTRPAGMRDDMRGGSVQGDARGNIVRENFKFMNR